MERHHILPKAKSLFPEYSDLNMFHWNSIFLTYRQHYVAHLLLSKVFTRVDHKSSAQLALYRMSVASPAHNSNRRLSSRQIEVCKYNLRCAMINNNPMHDPIIAEKAGLALKQYYIDNPSAREKLSKRRIGINNISANGIIKLRERWLGVPRPKTPQHIENSKKSSSIGTWVTPFGDFYNPTEASLSEYNIPKVSRHLIKKYCMTGVNGFCFIPKNKN
jgi:hypothetical protein